MIKFYSYLDDITGVKIYTIAGYEWNTLGRYIIRIFGEKRPEFKGSSRKVLRYFPQIDDNEKEIIYLIEPEPNKGFRKLRDAKERLERKMSELGIL